MLSVEQSIKKFLDATKQSTYEQQVKQGIYASGKSAASLKVTAKRTSGQLTGVGYFQFQFEGRRPGTMPPIKDIIAWLKYKRLKLNPWAVAMNIKKFGTKSYTDYTKRLDINGPLQVHKKTLLEDLGRAYTAMIVLELKTVTKAI